MRNAAAPKTPTIDFSLSGVPRYVQLATLFRRRIESGQWRVGEQIPIVDALAEECSVARATVRQALDILEDEQLIERFRAKGTFVRRSPQSQLWCVVPTDLSGLMLEAEGATIEFLDTKQGVLPGHVQHPIGALAPSYLLWRRRHLRDGVPYYIGDAWIDERHAGRIPKASLKKHTTVRILRDLPGLKLREIHQTITVGTADVELARMLDIALNAPVAHAYRTAIDERGEIAFVLNGVYRGDVVRLDMKVAL